MVELSILDTTAVSTSLGVVTGPSTLWVESATAGGVTVTKGYAVVLSGSVSQPLGKLTTWQAASLPAVLFFVFWLAFAGGRACFR